MKRDGEEGGFLNTTNATPYSQKNRRGEGGAVLNINACHIATRGEGGKKATHLESFDHAGAVGDVRKEAQFELSVIRNDQRVSFLCSERRLIERNGPGWCVGRAGIGSRFSRTGEVPHI